MKILVINGPNLNMLGQREKSLYGKLSLQSIEEEIKKSAGNNEVLFFQSNHEGHLIDRIHKAFNENVEAIIINAGAFTHTSIALRDALLAVAIPFIEVHITNVYSREDFRKKSYLSDIAVGLITGFKVDSYLMALNYFIKNK